MGTDFTYSLKKTLKHQKNKSWMQTQDTDTHIKWQSYQTSICQMFSKVCLCFFLYFTINNTCFDILHLKLWHSDTHGKWRCIFFPVVVFDSEETCIFLNVQFDQKCKQEYVYFAPCVSQPKGRLHEVEKTEGQRYERERETHSSIHHSPRIRAGAWLIGAFLRHDQRQDTL